MILAMLAPQTLTISPASLACAVARVLTMTSRPSVWVEQRVILNTKVVFVVRLLRLVASWYVPPLLAAKTASAASMAAPRRDFQVAARGCLGYYESQQRKVQNSRTYLQHLQQYLAPNHQYRHCHDRRPRHAALAAIPHVPATLAIVSIAIET